MAPVNLADFEVQAREAISGSVLDYYDGGANDEITLRDNPAPFGRIPLYPRMFRGTDRRDASATVLSFHLTTPLVARPCGTTGSIPMERPLRPRPPLLPGSVFVLSTFFVTPVEEVMASRGARLNPK
jgi:4-hydroxymandelate oxidase